MTTYSFNEQQSLALHLVSEGHNVLITGPGGVGKSALIETIYTQHQAEGKHVDICAMTGCAAQLINGRTLHSWAGLGIKLEEPSVYARRILHSKQSQLKDRWCDIDLLIVDEVSMMSPELFDTLNQLGQLVRKSALPFGGIQLVFVGDFYQLPPVQAIPPTSFHKRKATPLPKPELLFCFHSVDWFHVFPRAHHVILHQSYRHRDPAFAAILNQIRVGKLSPENRRLLNEKHKTYRQDVAQFSLPPPLLSPLRKTVMHCNETELNRLSGEAHTFVMVEELATPHIKCTCALRHEDDVCIFTEENIREDAQFMRDRLLCEQTLVLKEGAIVMSIKNFTDRGIFNGTQGRVEGFHEVTGNPLVRFVGQAEAMEMKPQSWESNVFHSVFTQLPLILAWAITIHKSQGMTMQCADVDVGSSVFETGQTYVALSRIQTWEGICLRWFDPNKIFVNSDVEAFYHYLQYGTDDAWSILQSKQRRFITPPTTTTTTRYIRVKKLV